MTLQETWTKLIWHWRGKGGVLMAEDTPSGRDMRFCPYCFQQQFDVSRIQGDRVYCEICGIDVEVTELVKQ